MILAQALMAAGVLFLLAVGLVIIIGLVVGVETYFRQKSQGTANAVQVAFIRWAWVTGLLILVACLAYMYVIVNETVG